MHAEKKHITILFYFNFHYIRLLTVVESGMADNMWGRGHTLVIFKKKKT